MDKNKIRDVAMIVGSLRKDSINQEMANALLRWRQRG